MKLLYIALLLSFTSPGWAEEEVNIRAARHPDRLERWQRISQNMSLHNMYVLVLEMYRLERKPWPEPFKQILSKMAHRYDEMVKAIEAGEPIIIPEIAEGDCGEINAQLYELISWQNDPRFIPFQISYLGGIAALGLANIGEPAFEPVIEALENDKSYAIATLQYMMEDENGFLRNDPAKQAIVRKLLMNATRGKRYKNHAMRALRYFPHPETTTFLEGVINMDRSMRRGFDAHSVKLARESLNHLLTN